MGNITNQQAEIQALKIVMRCLIMDVAINRSDPSDEGVRRYCSKLHEFASSQVEKITAGTSNHQEIEAIRSAVEAQIDRLFSGLGVSKA